METASISCASLSGYFTASMCRQMLLDLSAQLAALHASGKSHGAVCAEHITVADAHFVLEPTEQPVSGASASSDIWQLAATAFELVTGSPLFNGGGEKAQKANTPIPVLPYQESDGLNDLLRRCLDYRPESRPSASMVREVVEAAVKNDGANSRKTRITHMTHTQETIEKIDRSWPEKMIATAAHRAMLLLPLLMSAMLVCAQVPLNPQDEEVTIELVQSALLLRQGGEDAWNNAGNRLEKRLSQVTLMTELQDPDHDAPLITSRMKTFGVNRLVQELKRGRRVQNTGKELLDGADSRFNYSLYEKGVRHGATATYHLSGRFGKQVFVIVPYASGKDFEVSLLREDGNVIPVTGTDENVVVYFITDASNSPNEGETLTLTITNRDSSTDMAFVVINHNYRNR